MKSSKPAPPQVFFVSTADFGKIAENLLVTQKFDLQLNCKPYSGTSNIGETIIASESAEARNKFLNIIKGNVNPVVSKLTYTLNISTPSYAQDILSYEIGLASILARHENMQEYTYNTLGDITEELLNEKMGNIVAPMFAVDNKLNTMENTLKKVQDAYFFNNLSNGQTNYRFFDSM